MEVDIKNIDENGGYDPYKLKWDETINFPTTRKLKVYGNRIYNRYPARSIFLVPRATIYQKSKGTELNILDPFMGSGTTAVEGSLFKANIYGTEMDPFARLISDVSIFRFNNDEINELNQIFDTITLNWREENIDNKYYPILNNIEYWFSENIFEDLLRLKSFLYKNIDNDKYLNFMKIVFADCIKPSSKMERQSTKPYISSKFDKQIKPVDESFIYSFTAHLDAIMQYNKYNKDYDKKINWVGFDATSFNSIDAQIDLAITSPPYLNAFDYTQIIKVESAWVGTLQNGDINVLRNTQVGHEKRFNNIISNEVIIIFEEYYNLIINSKDKSKKNGVKIAQTCLSYFNDIYKNLFCVWESLKEGGEYHMIIGDNTVKGIEIPTHKLIIELSIKIGFEIIGYYKYLIKDHRTSIPRNNNGGKIKYEYVIILRK